jgi:leucyl aminopeptidase
MIALDATYKFDQFKSKKDEVRRPLRKLTLAVERRNELAQAEEALAQGLAIAEGMAMTKTLGNLPPNICHPTYLAEQAQAMAKEFKLGCDILERADMEKLGMHSLTFGRPRLTHQPPKADRPDLQGRQG